MEKKSDEEFPFRRLKPGYTVTDTDILYFICFLVLTRFLKPTIPWVMVATCSALLASF